MATFRRYRSLAASEPWGMTARGIVNRILRGKLNIGGEFALSPGVTETQLNDDQIGETSVILLTPMSASAALATPTTWLSPPSSGGVIVNHLANGEVDRNFRYIVMG